MGSKQNFINYKKCDGVIDTLTLRRSALCSSCARLASFNELKIRRFTRCAWNAIRTMETKQDWKIGYCEVL